MKNANKVTKNQVINFFKENDTKYYSKTEVSRDFGYKDISKVIKRIIDELLEEKIIVSKKLSGVEKYSYNITGKFFKVLDKTLDETTTKENSSCTDCIDDGVDDVISDIIHSDLKLPVGYELFREENTFVINTPNKENIVIDKDERLVVINDGEKLFKIKNKSHLLLETIKRYSTERGIKTYTVSSPKIGYFVHIDDVNKIVDDVIIFLTIKQEDKAN